MSPNTISIVPSILAADLGRLQEEVKTLEGHADWIQVDVMDGHFVPNLTFGAPVMKCIKTSIPLDIHLMVSNPAARLQEFLDIGARHITFHAEAVTKTDDRLQVIADIRKGGATAGIAINPETRIEAIDDVMDEVDLVLIMSVHPGFGGQTFIPEVLDKVRHIRLSHPKLLIQIDGGIDSSTAVLAREAGVSAIVAGSSIFSAKSRSQAIKALRGQD